MAPDDNSDDETLDMAHATVIEGADLESDAEVDLPSSAGPPAAGPPPFGSFHHNWSGSNPVGIPSSVASNHSVLSTTSSFFSPSSVSKYAPHAFEPSSVSSSYQTAEGSVPASGSFPHQTAQLARSVSQSQFVQQPTQPQQPQPQPLQPYGGSFHHQPLQYQPTAGAQPSSFTAYSTGTSFAEPLRRYGGPAASSGSSFTRHGSLSYHGAPASQQPPPSYQNFTGSFNDNRYDSSGSGAPPRRSLLTSMLQQKPGSSRGSALTMSPRRPSDTAPYARVGSSADISSGGFIQRTASRGASISRPTSNASSRRPSVMDMDVDPKSPDLDPTSAASSVASHMGEMVTADSAPMFIPSRSASTTNVSRTMVSTSTGAGVRSPYNHQPPTPQATQPAQAAPAAPGPPPAASAAPSSQGLFKPQYQPFPGQQLLHPVPQRPQPINSATVSPALSRAPSISLDEGAAYAANMAQSLAYRLIEAEKAAAPGGGRSILPALAPMGAPQMEMDIAHHDVSDVIEMVTLVLSQIVSANDALYSPESRGNPLETPAVIGDYGDMLKSTLLSFHGCNVPDISLRAYLARILKYCPATNEVFIAILVYFDRISRRLDAVSISADEPPKPLSFFHGSGTSNQLFVLDSYNVHRLIIASVTVASKFSSDIFYKNSRYAKVGGLPVEELNHLELQFLVLCDFKLLISVQELQHYADFLLKYRQQSSSAQPALASAQTQQPGPGSGAPVAA